MSTKYIFVTGGVVSGLGKGITAASLGRLLKARGLKVTLQKFDPYINLDPGRMSPYQHGEVFVTDDGAETDLDIGHYERFTDENMNNYSDVTAGQVYWTVLNKERKGEYHGGTVQVVPHITNQIKENIYMAGKSSSSDVVITEIGGTVGDIESQPFLEAIRQVQNEVGRENSLFIHVTLLPYISGSEELKSKPTQHSVKELLGIGIQPDILVCRTEIDIPEDVKHKLSLFCNVKSDCVIQNMTAPVLYEVPLMLEKDGLGRVVCERLGIEDKPDLTMWVDMVENIKNATKKCRIALVGKYVQLHDAYLSVAEALRHAGWVNGADIELGWIHSEDLNDENVADILSGYDGIIVPGGFGDRGIDGMISAVKYARENDIPFFGICLGMQLAVVEYARNVLGLSGAHSTEFAPDTANPVVYILPENPTGDMRRGLCPCELTTGTKAAAAYGEAVINERHRHRYEINTAYLDKLAEAGMKVSGMSPDGKLCEIIELPANKWFVGVEFHPEFKSRPNRPHPLFCDFIKASLK